MRIRHFLVLLAVAALVAACRSAPKDNSKKAWAVHLVTIRKVVSEAHGTVGYVKTVRFENPELGEPFDLYRVLDLNFVERGIITPNGTGTKYVELPAEIARARGTARENEPLPAQPLLWNVAKILDVPPDLKLVTVTPAELQAAGGTAASAAK